MVIVDAHCDTILRMDEQGVKLYRNNLHVDIERMRRLGSHVRFFAVFVSPSYGHAYSMKRAMQLIDKMYQEIEKNDDHIMLCRSYSDIEDAMRMGKIAALLSMEGGEALQGELSSLRVFHRLGVVSLCLTWNNRNELADGVMDGVSGGGVTKFGRDVLKEMDSLGMIIDVSHLSEKGFWDVMELSSRPVIASHSNARKICNHIRNLDDNQIKAIKDKGGVMGINFYPPFLSESGKATIKDIIAHIEHIAGLTGDDYIGIGSDFDGIEYLPDGIEGVEDMNAVFNELLRLNYTEEFIKKLAGKNFMRVIKQVTQSP